MDRQRDAEDALTAPTGVPGSTVAEDGGLAETNRRHSAACRAQEAQRGRQVLEAENARLKAILREERERHRAKNHGGTSDDRCVVCQRLDTVGDHPSSSSVAHAGLPARVQHKPSCAITHFRYRRAGGYFHDPPPACTCGLAAALRRLGDSRSA